MPPSAPMNRSIVMARRPAGTPTAEDFRLDTSAVPAPADGQVLLRTLYLSLDPYMRGRMSDGASYAKPLNVGDVMLGGTVCRVAESRHPDFAAGDLVLAASGWQDYALSSGKGLTRLPADLAHPSWSLGVLGMPGFTAYVGLMQIGTPKAGETVAVAAATGAVGSVVGQLARLHGCRVVGIAGGRTSATTRSANWASTPAWTTARPISPSGWRRPAPMASTSISKAWEAPCSMPSCRCSTAMPASRCAASSRNTTPCRAWKPPTACPC